MGAPQLLLVVILSIFVFLPFALLGRYIASKKGNSKITGFWIGGLFNFLGIVLLLLQPKQEK